MTDKGTCLNFDIKVVEEHYNTYYTLDPFPEIPPSLLNSSDIYNYVMTTGLISPFYPGKLKPASYGVMLKGEYIYWETRDKVIEGRLEDIKETDIDGDRVFPLKKNSIIFLALEPEFRFPSYITARFNLKIKHIYQGLLLGTGPLIDPGFQGKIYAPIHNLTNNDYKIKIDSTLIWMEFTKISKNEFWKDSENKIARANKYKAYDLEAHPKKESLRDYLNDAYPNGPILSTIPGILDENEKRMEEYKKTIESEKTLINHIKDQVQRQVDLSQRISTTFNNAIIVAIITFAFTFLFTITLNTCNQNRTIDYIDKSQIDQRAEHEKILDEKTGTIQLKQDFINLKKSVDSSIEKQNKKLDKIK